MEIVDGVVNQFKTDAVAVRCPIVRSFREYLERCARVPLRDGYYGPFSFAGRQPLEFIVDLIDAILGNTLKTKYAVLSPESRVLSPQSSPSNSELKTQNSKLTFPPSTLKGATLTVGGGAQWGKTVLVLNLQAYLTFVEFVNFGYYTPDQELLAKIVDTKFRPDVIDQQPWMAEMISLGKSENASGKSVNRKHSYQASDGRRKAFGHFCGMQKPPTTISLDAAALDEVDDIPARNMGYVGGRMTNSPLRLKLEIGTQRIAGAGQNARLKAGSFHVFMVPCPGCKKEWNLEEEFPRIIRIQKLEAGSQNSNSSLPALRFCPRITPEMGNDRNAHYFVACPDCGTELDRDWGRWVARNPHKIKEAHFSVRVSQLNISAISLQEIVGAWYAAMDDPGGDAMAAFYCDRIAIPNAGAAQPITHAVLERARGCSGGLRPPPTPPAESAEVKDRRYIYPMSLSPGSAPRFAGMDMGPRCWFWCDEVRDEFTSACVWAELIASGNAPTRVPELMDALNISCLFLDAGGEPDLTKRLVLMLNGLENYTPPAVPRTDLLKAQLSFPNSELKTQNSKLAWDGGQARWHGLRAAAVLFVAGEAKGIEQTIGFTQDGRIYPLIKCNRSESIQAAVNDFLTPSEGVLEVVSVKRPTGETREPRQQPRARLPQTYPGAGAGQSVMDGHLLNLRKERNPRTGEEDWIDGVENHLGLAKTYARLAACVGAAPKSSSFKSARVGRAPTRFGGHHEEGIVG